MARPSKLTDKQWTVIEKRLIDGESARALGREFGISDAAIRKRFGSQHKDIKRVANQMVEAEIAFKSLPISSQVLAKNLSDKLISISEHLAGAAEYGAMTAHRLAGIANDQVSLIDDAEPEKSVESLKRINALTKMANESSEIGINLLRANKEMVDDLNKSSKPAPPAIDYGKLSKEALREIVAAADGSSST